MVCLRAADVASDDSLWDLLSFVSHTFNQFAIKLCWHMATVEDITEPWSEAASELGIHFTGPIWISEDERKICFAGHVRDFGSPKGMLIFTSEKFEVQPWASVAEKNGFGWSRLNSFRGVSDLDVYTDILNDWGWSGKDMPPAWYTGKPRSS
jgi:hypothetical protein